MNGAIGLIREILDSCSDAERKVAETILAEPKTAVFCSAAELAQRAGTSAPAVVRLCKRAGLGGYRELQILCTRDLVALDAEDEAGGTLSGDGNDPVRVLVNGVFAKSRETLDRTLSLQNAETLEAAAALLAGAGKILLAGTGSSGIVAYDFSQRLTMIGISCVQHHDSHMQIAAACGLLAGDVAVCISYSGKTDSTILAAREAKRVGARVVSLTMVGSTPLSKLADIALHVPDTGTPIRLGTSMSRSSQLAVTDALYSILVSKNLDRSMEVLEASFKTIH